MFWNICSVCFMMLAEKKAPQQVSAAVLIPFRRERARALRVLALAAITTTTAPHGIDSTIERDKKRHMLI